MGSFFSMSESPIDPSPTCSKWGFRLPVLSRSRELWAHPSILSSSSNDHLTVSAIYRISISSSTFFLPSSNFAISNALFSCSFSSW